MTSQLPPATQFVLHVIAESAPTTRRELCKNLDLSDRTIDRALQRLEDEGHIERKPDPSDNRVSRVNLSDKDLANQ